MKGLVSVELFPPRFFFFGGGGGDDAMRHGGVSKVVRDW